MDNAGFFFCLVATATLTVYLTASAHLESKQSTTATRSYCIKLESKVIIIKIKPHALFVSNI